ncbi:hypothetical protein [uncultured Croceitalea sp.]|uniref:hypothetical protein n=1 Tax=uncultured Croceitalea sp. TaxID=1798908 RepID=UPI003305EB04
MTNEYENTLRKIIGILIGYDDDVDYRVTKERIAKWKEKRDIEKKKNKGVLIEPRLLFYSDFYDLKTIVEKNWELFKPILGDKKRFFVFFKEMEQYRNTIAHGRPLIASQQSLMSGIVHDLKNVLTIYNNRIKMKDDYFIEIGEITDNLGNSWGKSIFKRSNVIPTLKVGDQYEINIEANDPRDRKILYEIFTLHNQFRIQQDKSRFNFKIEKSLVGKKTWIIIKVSTPDSDYKNEATSTIKINVYPE